ATNPFGANMPTGHVSALVREREARLAVLEVDEHWLPKVIGPTGAEVVALLNLSRDQLDRAKEVAMLAQLWRHTLAGHPDVAAVANADAPMAVWAATAGGKVTWFSAGRRWRDAAWVCPQCGPARGRDPAGGWCGGGDPRPPAPPSAAYSREVVAPDGARYGITLALPGRVNVGNAATALAVAAHFGVDPDRAVPRLAEVTSVAGRYAQVERDGRVIRLLLAK